MIKQLKNILILIIIPAQLFATSIMNPNPIFDEANKLYEKADYKASIEKYNELLVKYQFVSPELYYNLGNAYYKNNEIAAAILNYNRALKIKPDFEDAIFNLKMANQKTIDKIDQMPELFIDSAYKNFVRSKNSEVWAYYAVGLVLVALISMIFYLLSGNSIIKKTGFYAGIFFLLLGLSSWFMASENNKLNQQSGEAIVFAKSVSVVSEPNNNSKKLFTLHEGIKVELIEKYNDWAKIKLANGHIGWMPYSNLQIV
ncbi:MAG: tetratricopeptide repeat protein [Flavobacteriales bacterium]|nr:tetratricopeptide repeat protein [Flavobacteriales bacterium]